MLHSPIKLWSRKKPKQFMFLGEVADYGTRSSQLQGFTDRSRA